MSKSKKSAVGAASGAERLGSRGSKTAYSRLCGFARVRAATVCCTLETSRVPTVDAAKIGTRCWLINTRGVNRKSQASASIEADERASWLCTFSGERIWRTDRRGFSRTPKASTQATTANYKRNVAGSEIASSGGA